MILCIFVLHCQLAGVVVDLPIREEDGEHVAVPDERELEGIEGARIERLDLACEGEAGLPDAATLGVVLFD